MKKVCIITTFVLAIVIFILGWGIRKEQDISDYEENVNKITEIDYSKQQEKLDRIVKEGSMNVNYSSKAIFDGKKSETFNVKNIKNNHHPIVFEILDEDGSNIYTSKKIEPGFEINNIELERELSKGIHKCQIKIGYAEEGNVSSLFPMTIEVK